MSKSSRPSNGAVPHWVEVRAEPPGQYTAWIAGLPHVVATAATRDEALQRVHDRLGDLLSSGQLVAIDASEESSLLEGFGKIDANDPHEQAYQEELVRS